MNTTCMNPLSRALFHVTAVAVQATCAIAQGPVLDWQLEPSPPSRNAFAMVRHAALDSVVLFGGEVYESMNDTWMWRDGWTRVTTPQAPSKRSGSGMVYDSLRQRIVLFGGAASQTNFNETWVFDGVSWTRLLPTLSPPVRYFPAMAYDEARDRVVLRGGQSTSQGLLSDLWEFDGANWQLRTQTGVTPSGPLVYDAARQEVLAVGTSVSAWNGSTWSARSAAGLPGGIPGTLAYDDVQQRVLAFQESPQSSTTQLVHAYQGTGWTQVAATSMPSDRYVGLAYDPTRNAAVGLRSALGSTHDNRSHTYVWSGIGQPGTAWQQVVVGLPAARRDAAMAYDPLRHRLVLHGGGEGIFTSGDLYEADQRTWLSRGSVSGTVAGHGMAFDTASGRLLVFGGESGSGPVYAWNGSTFVGLIGSTTIPQRSYNALAYDSQRQRLLVFGGLLGSDATNELWAWNGTAWSNVTAPGPSPRRAASMCYDAARDRVVMFGGSDAAGATFSGETWEYDGTAWIACSPAHAPAARAGAVLVHASHLQRCVLVGGFDAQDRRDTWTWDGSDWTPLVTTHTIDTGIGIAGAYDPDRREIVVFGGGTFLGTNPLLNRGELWRLRDLTLGTWTRSGLGCDAGAGVLRLEAAEPPALDTTVHVVLQNTPPVFVALPVGWIGFDDQQWNGAPLPISLAALGAPSCFVWADARLSVPMTPAGANATASLYLPYVPAALGMRLHLQAAVWNFATASIATADLLTGVVGTP